MRINNLPGGPGAPSRPRPDRPIGPRVPAGPVASRAVWRYQGRRAADGAPAPARPRTRPSLGTRRKTLKPFPMEGGPAFSPFRLDALRQGLLDFRAGYQGSLFLEVLLAAGVNDSEENLEALRTFCRELAPTRVDVVTLSRPGAHAGATAVSKAVLARFREALCPAAKPLVVTEDAREASQTPGAGEGHGPAALAARRPDALAAAIVASVRRRPQTAAVLAAALGQSRDAVQAALDALEQGGVVRRRQEGREIFYSG